MQREIKIYMFKPVYKKTLDEFKMIKISEEQKSFLKQNNISLLTNAPFLKELQDNKFPYISYKIYEANSDDLIKHIKSLYDASNILCEGDKVTFVVNGKTEELIVNDELKNSIATEHRYAGQAYIPVNAVTATLPHKEDLYDILKLSEPNDYILIEDALKLMENHVKNLFKQENGEYDNEVIGTLYNYLGYLNMLFLQAKANKALCIISLEDL